LISVEKKRGELKVQWSEFEIFHIQKIIDDLFRDKGISVEALDSITMKDYISIIDDEEYGRKFAVGFHNFYKDGIEDTKLGRLFSLKNTEIDNYIYHVVTIFDELIICTTADTFSYDLGNFEDYKSPTNKSYSTNEMMELSNYKAFDSFNDFLRYKFPSEHDD